MLLVRQILGLFRSCLCQQKVNISDVTSTNQGNVGLVMVVIGCKAIPATNIFSTVWNLVPTRKKNEQKQKPTKNTHKGKQRGLRCMWLQKNNCTPRWCISVPGHEWASRNMTIAPTAGGVREPPCQRGNNQCWNLGSPPGYVGWVWVVGGTQGQPNTKEGVGQSVRKEVCRGGWCVGDYLK